MSSFTRKKNLGDLVVGLSVAFGITAGVNIQVWDDIYTSNTVYKVLALVLPVSLAFFGLLLKINDHDLQISKLKILWIFAFISYSIYLTTSSPDLARFFVGTADRNLGGLTVGLGVLFFLAGRSLSGKLVAYVLGAILLNSILQVTIVGYQKFLQPDVPSLAEVGVFESPPIVGTFYNANPLSYFLGIIASGLCGLLVQSQLKKREIFLGSVVLVILFFGLIWSSSTQGLIGLCVTIVTFLVGRFVQPIRQRFSMLMAWLYSLGLIVFFISISFISISPQSSVSGNPYLERLEIYKTALKIASEHFFVGAGTDRFAAEYGKFTSLSDFKLVDNAHSVPLQIVSTQGILGLVLFLSFVFWILRLKERESSFSNSYWAFWQASFFAFAVIGIIGIEHPVITAIGFLSAGILSSNSRDEGIRQRNSVYKVSSKFIHVSTLIIGVVLSFTTYHFVSGELKAGNAISQLSQRKISFAEFESVIENEYEKIYNARVLLNAGQAYIAIGNKVGALKVANTMLSRFPDDQRTSVLFFSIAENWKDEKALEVAIGVRNQLFPKAKDF